ncbi:MAG: glycoside hydrolase family 127 protein [Saprospiraceae bacterium]|nr:glycoside hydrolase family 127 protein [Saprospiraceae bacterium]
MNRLLILCLLFAFTRANAQRYPIQPVPFQQVTLTDKFWKPRQEVVRKVTIPHTFQKNEETGRIKNFENVASASGAFCSNYGFDDSDVYKAIEGAAHSLRTSPDKKLEARVDSLIAKIAAAQEPDGYIYTWRTIAERRKKNGEWNSEDEKKQVLIKAEDPRWAKEDQHSHETYCAGHLYEAAVAWFQATGKRNLLDIALKNAELLLKDLGKGKLEKAPGHQEVEIGLVKLYQITGDKRFLEQAKFFLDVRGYGEAYMQNHQKVKDQREAVGHAVRLGYMFSAAADVTAFTQTDEYREAMTSVWEDIVGKKMYITGGVGSTGSNEGFSAPYELPNYSAYCETCSSIAFVWWCHRMFLLSGDARYVDVLERTLYNALNAGLSLTGNAFFYPNPLESRQNVERTPWFGCACCPSNLTRFYASLAEMFYSKNGNSIYVNLYGANKTTLENINSKGQKVAVELVQETEYPWEGRVKIKVNPAKPNTFILYLRIPGWAKGDAVPLDLYRFQDISGNVVIKLNGQAISPKFELGYAVIDRKWNTGDYVELEFPMQVRRIEANPKVEADMHHVALQRGPLMYCLEAKDQSDPRIPHLYLPDDEPITNTFEPGLLGGVTTLNFRGFVVNKIISPEKADLTTVKLKAVPYYAWANRGKDFMRVWIPNNLRGARVAAQATVASESKISASEGLQNALPAVADQFVPKNSNDQENPFVHWWPKFGATEWLQYDFKKAEQLGTVRVYWFDDERSGGGCRVPASWRLLYLENGEWKPVYAPGGFPVLIDAWNEVQFEPVKTTAMRLEMTFKEGVSGGVHEWEIK